MNYSKFYTSAREMLIDSMASMWFRGKVREQEYLRNLLMEEEPLLSEPVFQSIFPWESSDCNFEGHAAGLNILESSFVDALSSNKVDEEYRFPKERHPYKHQTESWRRMLSGEGKTIVVTSGTGSGKTECFMIPVLQDIARSNEKGCVQAIFLYPLNALMKSQQKRIDAWCKAVPDKITYAIYNGDTIKTDEGDRVTQQYYPQLVTRPQIRRNPPQILFTNPTMLNYMLVRAEDKSILEKSQGKLKWILLDEAHTYTGSSAAELSLQLKRVLDAFGVKPENVNFAVTSATIGDEKDPNTELKLKTFVSQLTGKPVDDIVVIGGRRIVPDMNAGKAQEAISAINEKYGTKITLDCIKRMREKINTNPVLGAREIVEQIDSRRCNDTVKALELIDALGDKVDSLNADGSQSALLPTRAHFFVRSISGVYTCVNDECSRHRDFRLKTGSLTTVQNTNCPSCKSRLLEIATCPSCGGIIVTGETSTSEGYRMHVNALDLDSNPFFEVNRDLIEDEENETVAGALREVDGYTPFYFAKPDRKCMRRLAREDSHVFNVERSRIEIASEDAEEGVVYKSLRHSENNADLCPHCGNRITVLNYLRASAVQMGRILSTLLLDQAEATDTKDADVLYSGRKYIAFTDNRQGSARFAMGLNQDVERSWIRSSIFHKLADKRIENVQDGGLTPEEEAEYQGLNEIRSVLPAVLKSRFDALEAKRNGNSIVPPPQETEWTEIVRALENDSDFRRLFQHIKNAKGRNAAENTVTYLWALMVDQFGWIPKRANSLETLGLVKLSYPKLRNAKCPQKLKEKGCCDEDWQDYLKICLDYFIKGNKHYMIAGEQKNYLTQNSYTSPVYPQSSDLRREGKPVGKWPMVKQTLRGVQEDGQNRLVLLLCAVLGYNDAGGFDEEKVRVVNNLLLEAWRFITENILELTDRENKGYMLDLLGANVRLQLHDRTYLCPVDNVFVDVAFCGYSPRMSGYIGKGNFERYKVKKEFHAPYFPFKSGEADEEKVAAWIDEALKEQIDNGVFSDLHRRVYMQKPIFIAAEHSAQQSREDLERYEKEFENGHLNILSCSTTMEMGVDIGGISEVVMNNVPPKSANYLQRAGRAGRRRETKAMALTFCAPNPIGTYTWHHPEYPITHVTETPLLKLESRQLIQRHVNALIFSYFVQKLIEQGNSAQGNAPGVIKVTSNLGDFFAPAGGGCFFDKFLDEVDRISGNNVPEIAASYERLVAGTGLESVPLSDAAYITKKNIAEVKNTFSMHLESIEKSLRALNGSDGRAAVRGAIERQKKNLLETSLLAFLAENAFLPSAGIPTGLVECQLGMNEKKEQPTMHLSQAISAYAPGSQVVRNEWIYEPAGIRIKTEYDDSTRYILQKCNACGYTTINYGSALCDCPKCGAQNSMHGLKGMNMSLEQRFTEVVEPAAFSTAWGDKPTRRMNTRSLMNFIQPVFLRMDPWEDKDSSAKMMMRCSGQNTEILFYNKGNSGYGFAFCPYCGRMESEKELAANTVMAGHKHLSTGMPCPGGENNGSSVRRHVLLVGRYQTDFVEIKFFDSENELITDSDTLYSLGVILSRKLTELLGVNDGEIDFGYDSISHSIFIYDTALGGAGYSTLFREYKDSVLELAYKTLKECSCERSCTGCLIDRRSQWYLNYLNRKKALEWIETERKSRIAPAEIRNVLPDANAVTTDFTTELYRLSRNRDIKEVKIFIDSDYSLWRPADFPYERIILEMGLSGVSAAFVLDRKIALSSSPPSVSSVVMSVLLKYNFVYCRNGLAGGLRPLLSVTFSNGKVKTYFGNGVNRTYSEKWGSGDVFATFNDCGLKYENVDAGSILERIAQSDDEVMFNSRLKDDCLLSTFCNLLTSGNESKWKKIKDALRNCSVSIEYSDRYLMTPLSCMLFAHLAASMKNELNLEISDVSVIVARIDNRYMQDREETNVADDFVSNDRRNEFLSAAVDELCGVSPTIRDSGYVEHERCMIIRAGEMELCIRPDAGIGNGWKPFGYENSSITDADFECDWERDMKLFNQKKNYKGILYTVSFNRWVRTAD